jgi:hypothetical protein
VPAGLEVELYPHSEGFRTFKPLQFAIECAQALVCPVELGFDSSQSVTHGSAEPMNALQREPSPVPDSERASTERAR